MNTQLLNNPIDVSSDYIGYENEYFIPSTIHELNDHFTKGKVEWKLHRYEMDWFFNKIDKHLSEQTKNAAPDQDYDIHPICDFDLSFISERTFRLRMKTTTGAHTVTPSLMIDENHIEESSRKIETQENKIIFSNKTGSVVLDTENFSIEIYDADQKLLTSTVSRQNLKAMHSKAVPFSFVRRAKDYTRNIAASFTLQHDEKIYGCGESFTSLNKYGQKVVIFSADAQSTASPQMYKPIPFFFSSRGYGMFLHTSAPSTFDFGHTHQGTSTIFSGDDFLDLFFFIGTSSEILNEYTNLTGKSPLPPLWSFGLWMGCFSYKSEKEVREVARKMREQNYPCDVIHIDAGWFEKGINCDFKFNKETFPDPEKMIADLEDAGFRVSVWQIPYFTPHNPVYPEVTEQKLYVPDANGNIPTEDAILDFSNPKAIEWYRQKLSSVLEKGVSAIKVDFGEAAPVNGQYASGKTGWYEHNLYPLRYNKIVSDLTEKLKGERIIWARSAFAGSQKYPLHWGGDSEVSDAGMAGSLRGGLSFGLSGFTFWSHDIGGFSGKPDEELYARWAFFGLMSSHSRVHGFPPREPWHYSEQFRNTFRKVSELRYRLMPYIYTQAALASSKGLPLMKPLLLNYPDDPTVWNLDNQYLLGNDILIAPLMEKNTNDRLIYLPEGRWINHSDKAIYEGEKWHRIKADDLKGILLYRAGAIIPTAEPAASTAFINWNKLYLNIVTEEQKEASGYLFVPGSEKIIRLNAVFSENKWQISGLPDKVDFTIVEY